MGRSKLSYNCQLKNNIKMELRAIESEVMDCDSSRSEQAQWMLIDLKRLHSV